MQKYKLKERYTKDKSWQMIKNVLKKMKKLMITLLDLNKVRKIKKLTSNKTSQAVPHLSTNLS